ncbi:MAG: hypothetical protein ACYC5O_10830 [Anaerolineae bacterium]
MKAVGLPILPAVPGGGDSLLPAVLTPGRLYMVNVLQREGDRALVTINGRRMAAEVIGTLPNQGRVPVYVREVSAERVLLQQAPEAQTPPATATLQMADLTAILARIGLPVRAEYVDCLAEMVRAGQPIVPEAVLELYEAWGTLANFNSDALPVLARLQSQGLPLISETLLAAERYEATEPLVTTETVTRLTQTMSGLAQRLDADPMHRQLEPLPSVLRTLARTLASLPLMRGADPTLPGQVASAVQTFSTPLEALLARLPSLGLLRPGGPDGVAGNGDGSAETAPDSGAPALPAPGEGGELVLRNPGNVRAGVPSIERHAGVQLRRLTNALDTLAERTEMLAPESREALVQTRAALSDLLSRTDAQQIANLRAPTDSTVPHFYAFSVPVAWSGAHDEVALRVYYRPGRSKRVDPANTHLAFRLTIAPLGTVEIDLRVFRRIVACDVRTESQAVNALAVGEAPGLHGSLQKLGYQVQAVRCSVQEPRGLGGEWSPEVRLAESLAQVNMVV